MDKIKLELTAAGELFTLIQKLKALQMEATVALERITTHFPESYALQHQLYADAALGKVVRNMPESTRLVRDLDGRDGLQNWYFVDRIESTEKRHTPDEVLPQCLK